MEDGVGESSLEVGAFCVATAKTSTILAHILSGHTWLCLSLGSISSRVEL
jgi:hypothetical protein